MHSLSSAARVPRALAAGVRSSRLVAAVRPLSTGPSSSSSAASSSFLSRHPKKIALAGAVVVGSAAYMSTKSSAPASPLPPFNLDDFRGFRDLDDFKQNQDIVLYQYETCPFCNKVRAYLDYTKVKYRVVEVNPMTKAEKKVNPQLAAIKEVPVLTINGHILTDSTPTIKNLNAIMNLYRAPSDRHDVTEDEISSMKFVDSRVLILTAPNIYRTLGESLRSFDYIAQNSQLSAGTNAVKLAATKYVGAVAMYLITDLKLNKKYGITDARASMYTALSEWMAGNGAQPFRGGNKPNLADITCFGVIRALQNYDAGRDIMNPANTSPEFVAWYRAVEDRVHKGIA